MLQTCTFSWYCMTYVCCLQNFVIKSYALWSQKQSQHNYMTGGLPPVSSFRRKAPWGSRLENFLQLNPCGHSSYVTSFLTRGWICLLRIRWALSSVHIANMAGYWKYFLLYTYKSFLCPAFSKQIMPLVLILCYNGSLVTGTVVSLATAKFKPLIFPVSRFALTYTANMFILMVFYDFCLLPTQFCCNVIVYIWKFGSRVQIAHRCAPWKISSCVENLVLQVLQF
jgi:hypothetical protein